MNSAGHLGPTTLGAACTINPPRPKLATLSDETSVMFIPMAAVDEVTGTVSAPELRSLGELRKKSYRSFAPGDVIFAKITPCMENGKAAIVPEIASGLGFGSTEFHVLRPKPGTDARFIWHYVRQRSFRQLAEHRMTGSVGQLRVPASFLEQFPIDLPDSSAQSQLADRLDGVAALVGSGNQHLASASQLLRQVRQAVLAAACAGRLTAVWRAANPDVEPAEALVARLDRSKQARLEPRYLAPAVPVSDDLPEGWTWATVGQLVNVATGATPLRARPDYYGGKVPWVTSGATNSRLITGAAEYITERAIKETNAKVFPPGTLLVAMYGEGQTRGRVAELGISAATNQAVAALLFNDASGVLRPYLHLFFLENYERIRRLSFGGVQPNLSLGVIKDTLVPLPPLAEQVEIVRRVDTILAIQGTADRQVDLVAERINHTSEAILARALNGELVAGARA